MQVPWDRKGQGVLGREARVAGAEGAVGTRRHWRGQQEEDHLGSTGRGRLGVLFVTWRGFAAELRLWW